MSLDLSSQPVRDASAARSEPDRLPAHSHVDTSLRRLDPTARLVHYSITSSVRASSEAGIVIPSALAALRLRTSSYLDGCSTGKSAGVAPFRILSTYAAVCRATSSWFAP